MPASAVFPPCRALVQAPASHACQACLRMASMQSLPVHARRSAGRHRTLQETGLATGIVCKLTTRSPCAGLRRKEALLRSGVVPRSVAAWYEVSQGRFSFMGFPGYARIMRGTAELARAAAGNLNGLPHTPVPGYEKPSICPNSATQATGAHRGGICRSDRHALPTAGERVICRRTRLHGQV